MGYKIAFYIGTHKNPFKAIQQWAVRLWTLGMYSHSEFIRDNGSDDPNEWDWMSATTYNPGVTAIRKIKFNPKHWHVYDLPDEFCGKPVTYDEAVEWTMNHLGRKYDWLGIFLSQVIPLDINDRDKFFCSEFNACQLQQTRLLKGDVNPPQSYSPMGLYRQLKRMGAIKRWQK